MILIRSYITIRVVTRFSARLGAKRGKAEKTYSISQESAFLCSPKKEKIQSKMKNSANP